MGPATMNRVVWEELSGRWSFHKDMERGVLQRLNFTQKGAWGMSWSDQGTAKEETRVAGHGAARSEKHHRACA